MTGDEGQRGLWTFYEVVKFNRSKSGIFITIGEISTTGSG